MTRLSLAISLVTQANEGCGVMAGTVPWAISAQSESRIGSIPAGVGDTPKLQPLQGRMRNQQEDHRWSMGWELPGIWHTSDVRALLSLQQTGWTRVQIYVTPFHQLCCFCHLRGSFRHQHPKRRLRCQALCFFCHLAAGQGITRSIKLQRILQPQKKWFAVARSNLSSQEPQMQKDGS